MFNKLVKDAFLIVRASLPITTRLRLLAALFGTVVGRDRILGFKVDHVGRTNLRLLFSEIFVRREYDFASVRPDPVILDCGANIGMATLFFKWRYPSARITAFEPDPVTFGLLEANVAANRLSGVSAHNVALAADEALIPFHVPGDGSLLMSAVPSRTVGGRVIDVPAKRLSSYVTGAVDLLKLDVEGMEGPVLEDLASSGALAHIREAIIEVHHNLPGSPTNLGGVIRLLDVAGFTSQVVGFYSPPDAGAGYQDVVIHATRTSAH